LVFHGFIFLKSPCSVSRVQGSGVTLISAKLFCKHSRVTFFKLWFFKSPFLAAKKATNTASHLFDDKSLRGLIEFNSILFDSGNRPDSLNNENSLQSNFF